MSDKPALSQRQYDIDWLRVLAILVVFIFHSGRFFDTMPWHVKSTTVYSLAMAWTVFLSGWMMPFIFLLSGASLFYMVGKNSVIQFTKDKVLRLFIPLVVGIFTHISIAVYLERISNRQFTGSFFQFYPHYFDGMYRFGGNFAWSGLHLWYLLVLFIFSLLFLPLFYLLKGSVRGLLDKLGNILAVPGIILVLILPIAWLSAVLDPRTFLGQRNFGGWPLPVYICYLLYGFFIFSHTRLQTSIQKMRWFYLVAALAAASVLIWRLGYLPPEGSMKTLMYFGLCWIISSWCFILAFIGFASKHLTNNTPLLKYSNEAVLPFYIMHQTVLLVVGYFMLQWPISDLFKWIIIAISSFLSIIGLYEFLIRRFNGIRFLFGMKLLIKQSIDH